MRAIVHCNSCGLQIASCPNRAEAETVRGRHLAHVNGRHDCTVAVVYETPLERLVL